MAEQLQIPDLSFLDGVQEPRIAREYLAKKGDDAWDINDSTIHDYGRRANFFRDPEGLVRIIRSHIGFDTENVALDLGAGTHAQALRDLLDSGAVGRALATNYEDRRLVGPEDPRLDRIAGDLTLPSTWRDIIEWQRLQASQGFNLVMHRPIAGLQKLPPRAYRGAAHLALDIAHPEGLMFTQVPRSIVEDPPQWDRLCRSIRNRPDVLRVIASPPRPAHVRYWKTDESDAYALILKGSPGA